MSFELDLPRPTRDGRPRLIVIDPGLAEAPYDQVKRQITEMVADGTLAAGDKLPTVRRLADGLGIAPNTVARAYRELEAAAVVATRGRAGTFVSGSDRDRAARQAAAQYVQISRALGLSTSESIELVHRALTGP